MPQNLNSIRSSYIEKNKSQRYRQDFVLSSLVCSRAYTVFKVSPDFSNAHLCICSIDNWDPRVWLTVFLSCKVRKDCFALILFSWISKIGLFYSRPLYLLPVCKSLMACVWLKHNFSRVSRIYLKMSRNWVCFFFFSLFVALFPEDYHSHLKKKKSWYFIYCFIVSAFTF